MFDNEATTPAQNDFSSIHVDLVGPRFAEEFSRVEVAIREKGVRDTSAFLRTARKSLHNFRAVECHYHQADTPQTPFRLVS